LTENVKPTRCPTHSVGSYSVEELEINDEKHAI